MSLVIGVTLWLTFSAFLLFPHLGAPPAFSRMAIGLCGSEMIVACAWGWGRLGCMETDCTGVVAIAESAAGVQIPLLTGAMFLAAIVYGLRIARSW